MPRPILPPTPQSSVDLPPKPPPSLSSLELSFTLPPPALGSIASSTSAPPKPSYDVSSPPSSSSSNYTPLSPTPQRDITKKPLNEANSQQSKKRRRASPLETLKPHPSPNQKPAPSIEAITLPPPPTRNRKIIQMKPRQPSTSSATSSIQQASAPEPKSKSKKAAGSKLDKPAEDGKPTTAVGRKIARKTAHSLIERRRRFKMNEEFGVLKGMIPACAGVEMHKLAILQASIEYLRYLEQCVADLKANSTATHQNEVPMLPPRGYDNEEEEEEEEDEDEENENDDEMVDLEHANHEQPQEQAIDNSLSNKESHTKPMQTEELTPTFSTFHAASRLTSPSSHSIKSQYSPTQSQCSPTFLTPQPMSTTTSPSLYPQQYPSSEHGHDQVDTEATHALLLLADGRRSSEAARSVNPEKKGRGMSVMDLLSP